MIIYTVYLHASSVKMCLNNMPGEGYIIQQTSTKLILIRMIKISTELNTISFEIFLLLKVAD